MQNIIVICGRICRLKLVFVLFEKKLYLQDAYAEPGQDSRNIAGIEIVIVVEDVQDEPPVFTLAPPVTRLPSGLLPGDKVSSFIKFKKIQKFDVIFIVDSSSSCRRW